LAQDLAEVLALGVAEAAEVVVEGGGGIGMLGAWLLLLLLVVADVPPRTRPAA